MFARIQTKDFMVKTENLGRKKQGKRQYLNNKQTRELMTKSELYFDSMFDIPGIKVGKKQTIETLINKETSLFAKYLRTERKTWNPKVILPY